MNSLPGDSSYNAFTLTDDEEAFVAGFEAACAECIQAARRMKYRLASGDVAAAEEYGRIVGMAMKPFGASGAECRSYGLRVLAMVSEEGQA